MERMKRFTTAFLAALLPMSLAACGSTTDSSTTTTEGAAASSAVDESADTGDDETMYIEVTTAPVGLHPLKTNDAPSSYITDQIFETLYRRTVDGTSYEPLLAADMPVFSEDGLTATIALRQDVTFSDGTPFTADAVAYMIDCLKDENYGSLRPSIVDSINDYTIVDDYTIELHLAYEDGVLVAKLAHTNGAIVNPELDKTQDLMVDPTGAGTGPYVYESSTAGSHYVLKANENYWGGAPAIKTLVYDVVADEATAIARLQTGEADFYPTLSVDSYETAAAIEGYTAVSEESGAIYYLANRSSAETAANPLMANADFRKALFEAIDIETYVESVVGDNGTFVKSIVGPTLAGYTSAMDDAYVEYDPEDAQAIIDANGWSGQTITMFVSTREWQQTAAAYIQDELSKVGINVNIVSEEWASFLTDSKNDGVLDMVILSWSNITGDGQQMLEPNFSTANGLRVMYNNAEFDALVEASAETTDLAERQQYMLEAVQMIQGDCVVTPFYSPNNSFCYNSTKFADVSLDKAGMWFAKDFSLAQ
jgi:peptide/nickel transport system substrate-binding protein